uniref:GH18 domain-containing protein n=1 Tax=viral metagenome TaxID=1070528 RepID=A0A6C0EGR3_9ZZZZ
MASLNKLTHIHLASIHFDAVEQGDPIIHLNNSDPEDPIFASVWKELEDASKAGVKIVLMVGGAGGAFGTMFSAYDHCYSLLKNVIKNHPFICGIDLDIEEYMTLEEIKKLINDIHNDFGDNFIISLAPLAYELIYNNSGMSGFVYKDLYDSEVGKYIHYFNTQSYDAYCKEVVDDIVDNGYPAAKIVLGMMSEQMNIETQDDMLTELKLIKQTYPTFGGVYDWELFDAYPTSAQWIENIHDAVNIKVSNGICSYVTNKVYSHFAFLFEKLSVFTRQ